MPLPNNIMEDYIAPSASPWLDIKYKDINFYPGYIREVCYQTQLVNNFRQLPHTWRKFNYSPFNFYTFVCSRCRATIIIKRNYKYLNSIRELINIQ